MTRIALLAFLASSAVFAQENFISGQGARMVLGQKTFTEQAPAASQNIIGSPRGVAAAGNILVVVDSNRVGAQPNNNRILIYRDLPRILNEPRAEVPQGTECPACLGEASVVLGQQDFVTTDLIRTPSAQNVRSPIGVAYNGQYLAIADTDFNRILVWRSLPTTNYQNADIVIGQANFTSSTPGLSATQLRGPQGVWLDSQNNLWVADTGNDRVLFFGVPSQNGQSATIVLGQKDFTSKEALLGQIFVEAKQSNLRTPMSVTTDGTHLFVSDLGFNRVLIWNSIPTSNAALPDVVLGQKDFATVTANNSTQLCDSNGTLTDGTLTYPVRCNRTLNWPRYALSDGRRLFIADSGNDRVLVYDRIPLLNGAAADSVLGQFTFEINQSSDSAEPLRVSSSDSFRTPHALAWDGINLYVTDVFNRRVLVYTPGDFALPVTAVRNSASTEVFAVGGVAIGGAPGIDEELKIKIKFQDSEKEYTYKTQKDDFPLNIAREFVAQINGDGGNPAVIATLNGSNVILTSRFPGPVGNQIELSVTVPATATTVMSASGSTLSGGQDAARIAPFTLVTILGENLADQTASVAVNEPLPTELGGVQVYFNGIRAPIQSVSPKI